MKIYPWQWRVIIATTRSPYEAGHRVAQLLQLEVALTPPQLTRHAYPGQASTRAQHVVQPCCCIYVALCCGEVLNGTLWRVGPGQWCEHRQGWGHIATGFLIHLVCPHHGHLANTHLIERLWEDPYSNGLLRDPYDMDDDERSGH